MEIEKHTFLGLRLDCLMHNSRLYVPLNDVCKTFGIDVDHQSSIIRKHRLMSDKLIYSAMCDFRNKMKLTSYCYYLAWNCTICWITEIDLSEIPDNKKQIFIDVQKKAYDAFYQYMTDNFNQTVTAVDAIDKLNPN